MTRTLQFMAVLTVVVLVAVFAMLFLDERPAYDWRTLSTKPLETALLDEMDSDPPPFNTHQSVSEVPINPRLPLPNQSSVLNESSEAPNGKPRTVQVFVVNDLSEPVDNPSIELTGNGVAAIGYSTSRQGTFSIELKPDASASVIATASGYFESEPAAVGNDNALTIQLKRKLDATGKPIAESDSDIADTGIAQLYPEQPRNVKP